MNSEDVKTMFDGFDPAQYEDEAKQRWGAPVTDASVQDLVEQHRLHTERWFYPCSKDMQRGLGEMYVADPRFTANLDGTYGDGFAAYLRDAICVA